MYQNVNSELLNLPLILWKKIQKKIIFQSEYIPKKKVRLS